MQERIYVEAADYSRPIYPDVVMLEHPPKQRGTASEGDVAVAEPLVIHVPHDEVIESFIEIIDTSGNRVITVIEVLSPVNKTGAGQEQYLQKQRELVAGRVSLVEIDLLRSGKRRFGAGAVSIPESHKTTYQICVHRGWREAEWEIYRAPLAERLPVIRVPLRQTDKDVTLDIQAIVDQSYRQGRYDDLDYRRSCEPPLEGEEAAWAEKVLASAGQR